MHDSDGLSPIARWNRENNSMEITASSSNVHDLHSSLQLEDQTGPETATIDTHKERDDASSVSTFYLDPNLNRFEELLKRLEKLVYCSEEQLNG
ncbi:hypothetical protein PG993_010783 [Apiospora rasikravindrae]|uniref:Uncharacterized protein n=1 Tax=Apiospora rasikravindrae TaxID=990691 RepID=A0ABR1SCD4_9PEZI